MFITDAKVLVHFNTNEISVNILKNNTLEFLSKEFVSFEASLVPEILLEIIDNFLKNLEQHIGSLNNECVRLYATGIFQNLTQLEQTKLIIDVYVNYGLYFNIVHPDLEHFYLENSIVTYGVTGFMEGLIYQEFRKVVVCGSFQHHMQYIGDVMNILYQQNITVLSPWTTKIVPETLGTDFILLEGQSPLKNKRDSWRHKYEHMEKFRQSDAIIVCNPDGVIGKGTMFEFGFMVALCKRIIFTEVPKELSISFPYEVGLNF